MYKPRTHVYYIIQGHDYQIIIGGKFMNKEASVRHMAVKPDEAAKMLGVGRSFIYAKIKSGEIQAIRLGERRLLVPVAALEKLLEI